MYSRSARYYDALYHFKDYGAASAKLHDWIRRENPQASSLLEVACGTGKFLEHLREWYQVEGLDLSPQLLGIARERCPGVPLHEGDMAAFSLGKGYDVVACLFSSIGYVRTPERLRSAIRAMADHLNPGGLLIVEPWFSKDRLWTGHITANFVDRPDLKIAWMYTTEVVDDLCVLDIHYLVGTPEGVEHFTERHELGLFADEVYRAAFEDAGLEVRSDPDGLFGRGMYLGSKPET